MSARLISRSLHGPDYAGGDFSSLADSDPGSGLWFGQLDNSGNRAAQAITAVVRLPPAPSDDTRGTSPSVQPAPAPGITTAIAPSDASAAASYADVPTLANYLVNGYWGGSGHHWTHSPVSVNITGLTAAEQTMAQTALGLWDDVCNINFSYTAGSADITYVDSGSGVAVTNDSVSGVSMSGCVVDISSDWAGGASTGIDSYFFQTYVHETGHALGLGHQGPYNGSATYGVDNIYTNDTWRWSVMSYFSQNNYGSDSYDYAITPEMADIYAVQSIYGAQTTRADSTTYGFNSNAGSFYNFSSYSSAPAFTIYDSGGYDTIDASGYSANQTIDLTPGDWSSIGGYTDNVGIYLTTTIESAIGGSGNDTVLANNAGDNLTGNAGDDTLWGGSGVDVLSGGDGNDTLNGGDGNDYLYGGNNNDSLKGAGGADYLDGGAGIDTATYAYSSTGVDANLSTGVGQFGDAAGDHYLNIENLYGSTGNDTLTGDAGANSLSGGDGNDTIDGFLGDDTLDGGAGTDTLSYGLDRGVTVSLATAAAQNTGGSGIDTVSNFENLTGSYFNDTLTGDAGANVINGNGGSDTIIGGDGNDTIYVGSPDTYIVKPQATHNSTTSTATDLDHSFVETYASFIQNSTTIPHATVLATASGGLEYYRFTVTAGATAVFDIDQTTPGLDTYLELFSTDGTTLLTTADDSAIDPGSQYAYAGATITRDSYLSYTFSTAGTYYLRVDQYPGGVAPAAGSNYTLNVSLSGATLAHPTAGSTIDAGPGTDAVYGNIGNDRFFDSDFVNSDGYYGGGGIDTVDYSPVTFANNVVTINLALGQTVVTGGNTETLSGIQNIEGSQGGELLILGNHLNNVLDGNGGNDTIDGFLGDDTLNGGAGTDTLSYALDLGVTVSLATAAAQNTGGSGIDTISNFENLTGSFFNDTLTGNAGNNIIKGNGGHDIINGGAGNDTLIAGDPNAYIVKQQSQNNSGIATAVNLDGHYGLQSADFIANSMTIPHATVTATASGNFEYYSFSVAPGASATFDIDQTSPGLDTYLELFSTDGTTLLASGDDSAIDAGSDNPYDSNLSYTFAGGGVYYLRVDNYPGNVSPAAGSTYTLNISLSSAVLTSSGTGSTLSGGDGNDALIGGAGNDTLNGGTGIDTMTGGGGNDVYYVDNAADRVNEAVGGGADTVYASVGYALQAGQEVEYLRANAGATGLSLTGNAFNNYLIGGTGNDTLDGGTGADTMAGGAGNDTYTVDNAGDVVNEVAGAGIDTLKTSLLSKTLGANLENLTYTGAGNFTGTGNALNNVITGGAGNDALNGGIGADTMAGGAGNDTYIVDNVGDVVSEAAGAGTDTIKTTLLSKTLGANVENLTFIGAGNFTGTGNTLNNVITGGSGNDTLNGGAGNDTLRGGAGQDSFMFNQVLKALTNVDNILDFSVVDDKILLSHLVFSALGPVGILPAAEFHIGPSAGDTNDRIIYNSSTGVLNYDADGTGAAASVQFAHLTPGLAMTNSDFRVV